MQRNNKGFITLVFYDLPTTYDNAKKAYRVFRKSLIKMGYYQLQESVYCKSYKDKGTAKKALNILKSTSPSQGNIRALILTKKTFDSMEIILGEMKIEEKILRKESNVLEL